MSIRVNCKEINTNHSFGNIYAFVDAAGDFYLIDEESEKIVLLTHMGCIVYNIDDCDSVEEFLDREFGGCKVAKVYTQSNQYEIIVNG